MDLVTVRAAVERMARELAALALVPPVLQLAWDQMVGALALSPAAVMRDCPHCGNQGMGAATLCGYCWKKLTPLEG
jgi:hypothetical protein